MRHRELNEYCGVAGAGCLARMGIPDDATHVNPNGRCYCSRDPFVHRAVVTAALYQLCEPMADMRSAHVHRCRQGIALILERV